MGTLLGDWRFEPKNQNRLKNVFQTKQARRSGWNSRRSELSERSDRSEQWAVRLAEVVGAVGRGAPSDFDFR